jgi:predicted HicB family RNase H-like nuclease
MAICAQRRAVHDNYVRFRLSTVLLTQAEKAAAREGVSISEYTRTALRRELERV